MPAAKPSAETGFPSSEPLYRQLIAGHCRLEDLKARRIETKRRERAIVAEANIHTHFRRLREEFGGKPELCFVHAQLVVCIRRSRELETVLPAFFSLWRNEAAFLTEHLDSRWLISACDTFADFGSPAQQAGAMPLVALINTVKLAETERRFLADPDPLPERIAAIPESHRRKLHVELWDGMMAYAPFTGDMPRNLFRRMMRLAGEDEATRRIAHALIGRAIAADTLLGRLARMNPEFLPPEMRTVDSPPLAPA